MFRHPLSRLVSAFMYCQYFINDPLCASAHFSKRGTFVDWAAHWGNYLFRELILYPPILEVTLNTPQLVNAAAKLLPKGRPKGYYDPNINPAWMVVKVALLNSGSNSSIERAEEMIKSALLGERELGPMYDTFGVVEKWSESMALFDRHVPLSGFTWAEAAKLYSHKASHAPAGIPAAKYKSKEAALLATSQNDSAIARLISIDLRLYYETVIPRFEKAAKELELELV